MPRRRRRRAIALDVAAVATAVLAASRVARADFAIRDFSSNATALTFQGAARAVLADASDETYTLRLTPAKARTVGSAYAKTKQLVRGGFVSEFAFRLHAPSGLELPCQGVDHAPATCSKRGGDGFAFVIQNHDARALGSGASQLGYGGVLNAVAVEFDTFHDAESMDPYHNHVAVLTRGANAPVLSSHDSAIASSVDVPNLSDGERHFVRLEYTPNFIAEHVAHKSFRSSAHLLDLMRDYKHGLGTLRIFVDNLGDAALTVPINLGAFLDLDNGRAWVGFSASTSRSMQYHDVQSWSFRERLDELVADEL